MEEIVNGGEHFSQVHIAKEKITDYLLNVDHTSGKGKAKFFTSIGFSLENPKELETVLSNHPQTAKLEKQEPFRYGIKYTFICDIIAPDGKVFCIVSVWRIAPKEVTPHLITAYPAKRK